jgi:hypothetical protein
VNVLVVVAAETLLLLAGPGADGLADIAVGVLAADHEADLAGWVGGDCGVGVFGDGEDLLAGLLEVGDEREMEPLVLGCEENTNPNRSRVGSRVVWDAEQSVSFSCFLIETDNNKDNEDRYGE